MVSMVVHSDSAEDISDRVRPSWAISRDSMATASWPALMNTFRVTGESYLFPQLYSDTEFITRSHPDGLSSTQTV